MPVYELLKLSLTP